MPDITQSFSQLLLTYGPGAMLDLSDHAVIISGLHGWRYGADWKPVSEDRLVPLLLEQLGAKLSSNFSGLRQPPAHATGVCLFRRHHADLATTDLIVRFWWRRFLGRQLSIAGRTSV